MFANEKAVSLRDDICPPGRRSVAAVRVSHASATTHPESGIAWQRASRRPAMVYPHPVADAPFPPIMESGQALFALLSEAGPSGAHKASRAALHPPSAQRRLGSGHCRTMRGCDLHFVPPRFPSRKDGPYDPAPPRPRPHTVQSTYILPPHSSQSAHAGTRQGLPCRPDTSVDSL